MIRNPYAKKAPAKQSPATARTSSSTVDRLLEGANPIASSFSQAFDVDVNDEPAQQQQEQHAVAQQTVTDRDNHAYLHQPHVLYVSLKQKGNGVLNYIRNVPTAFQKMVPDFIFGSTSCALFLSIKYHNLYPKYILNRMAALRDDFTLRVLLVLVDVEDNTNVLLYLNTLCVKQNYTLILAWSEEEAARYLETYKALNGKDASTIQKSKDSNTYVDQVVDFLTTAKVSKTDATNMISQFDSIRNVMAASPDELALVSGLGQVKVKRLYDAFHKPFSGKLAKERRDKRLEQYRLEKELADAVANDETRNQELDDGLETTQENELQTDEAS